MSQIAQSIPGHAHLTLPVEITKGELCRYFDCNIKTLWRRHLTDQLLAEWGVSYEDELKHYYRFSVQLTKKIIQHWEITPVVWYSKVYPSLISSR